MRIYKADAIILKRRNSGEADRILTVFSKEYGKIRLIAKGIRKITSRRAPHLEIFSRVRLLIHEGNTLDSVSEVSGVNSFEAIRKDLKRVGIAYFLCELVDALTAEKQESADVFSLLAEALENLNKGSINAKLFTLELLWLLGFLPRTKTLEGKTLRSFIEDITERPLKSPSVIKLLYGAP